MKLTTINLNFTNLVRKKSLFDPILIYIIKLGKTINQMLYYVSFNEYSYILLLLQLSRRNQRRMHRPTDEI